MAFLRKKKKKEDKAATPVVEKEMSFIDHLEELRWHLVRSILAILVVAIAVFISKDFIFDRVIFWPLNENFSTYQWFCGLSEALCFSPPDLKLIPREMGEQFLTHIKVSFWLGLITAFPYVFWELWRFIKPGLYSKEKKAARGIVFTCSVLFLSGVLFGYYIISPFAISFLGGYQLGAETVNSTSISSYVNYMTMFTLPTGILFLLPVFVYFFSIIGLLTPATMRKYRKHAFIGILILSAVITPPDVVTQFLIGIPIYILYEASIYISGRAAKQYDKSVEG